MAMENCGQLVQLQGERGRDAEVSAAAVQGPEQLGVLVGARVDRAAVRGHQFDAEQVVDGQAEPPLQPAGAAAEHEAADAGGGGPAAGGRQAVRLGGPVQVRSSWRRRRPVPPAAAGIDGHRRACGAGRRPGRRRSAPCPRRCGRRRAPRSPDPGRGRSARTGRRRPRPRTARSPPAAGRSCALKTARASSYPGSPGANTSPVEILAQRGEGRARLRAGRHGRPLPRA